MAQTVFKRITAADVGARPDDWIPTAGQVGALPITGGVPEGAAYTAPAKSGTLALETEFASSSAQVATAIADSIWTVLSQVNIPSAGDWLLMGMANYPTNSTGSRGVAVNNAPSATTTMSVVTNAVNGAYTVVRVMRIVHYDAPGTAYALGWQKGVSGTIGVNSSSIEAIKIK